MKFFLISSIFSVLWISANCVSIKANNASVDDDTNGPSSLSDDLYFLDCMRKFVNHESYGNEYVNWTLFYNKMKDNIIKQVVKEGLLKNLYSIVEHSCYSVVDRDAVLPLLHLFEFCYKIEVSFAPLELLIFKENQKNRFCYIDIMGGALMWSINMCNPGTNINIQECFKNNEAEKVSTFERYWGTQKSCKSISTTRDCIRKVVVENCQASAEEQWGFYYDHVNKHNGCNISQI